MGSMTENIADKAINDTRIVKQFTNPVKEPIDSDINLFDLLDNRAKRDKTVVFCLLYKLRKHDRNFKRARRPEYFYHIIGNAVPCKAVNSAF